MRDREKSKALQTAGIIAAIVIVIGTAVSLIMMLGKDSKPSGFEIKDGSFVISGSFGMTVPLTDLTDLHLVDTMPGVSTMANGAWLKNNCKGLFILDNDAKAHVYATIDAPPFITFYYKGEVFYINTGGSSDTQALYDQIKSNIK